MKMALAAAAAIALAGSAMGQTIVNNIPGTFIDISGTGTFLGGGDDNSYGANIPAGSANAYFPAGTMNACTNGHAGYGGVDTQYSNGSLPASFGYTGNVALPFWDDLITQRTGAGIYTQTIGNTTIIQWNAMDHFFSTTNAVTFELKIFGGGTGPGGALAQYIYQSTSFGDATLDGGASATIGFQTPTGFAQYSLNTASVQAGSVLSIVPSPSSLALLGLGGLMAGRRRR